MRKFFLLIALFSVLSLSANPMIPRLIQQFWFDDAGDMMLQFGHETAFMSGSSMSISDGTNSIDFALTDFPTDFESYPININLSELMPDLLVTAEAGLLVLEYDEGFGNQVAWGPSGDVDLHSIIATQSIYQTDVSDPLFGGSYRIWAKSDHPDFVSDYSSTTSSTIRIFAHYEDSTPVTGLPLYYQDLYNPYVFSDENGLIEVEVPCARTLLKIYQPDSEQLVFSENFIAEPAGCYVYNVELQSTANQDLLQQRLAASMILSPNVLKPGQSMRITFDKEIAAPSRIRLFDLKGRLLGEYQYSENWHSPALSSGVYFLQVLRDDLPLSRSRFIMLK
jgi:hypothetical protein